MHNPMSKGFLLFFLKHVGTERKKDVEDHMEVEIKRKTEGNKQEILDEMAVRLGHFPPEKSQMDCKWRGCIRGSGREFVPQNKKQSTPVEFLCYSMVLSNSLKSLWQKRAPISMWQKIKTPIMTSVCPESTLILKHTWFSCLCSVPGASFYLTHHGLLLFLPLRGRCAQIGQCYIVLNFKTSAKYTFILGTLSQPDSSLICRGIYLL